MNIQSIVFFSLILDLFAFTIPLPLFPRLVEWFTVREANIPNGLLSNSLSAVRYLRGFVYDASKTMDAKAAARWDVVLLGGLMGSLFSFLQWLVSPFIGTLSDKYGRKRVLIWTMFGNILSAVVWLFSTSWATYLLSRAIGGLSEGNVQLATAILSDITSPESRSRSLALIGIAFSCCFVLGPPIGAYFASKPLPKSWELSSGIELNVYATPAFISLVLLVAETIFLAAFLPETRGTSVQPSASTNGKPTVKRGSIATRMATLAQSQRLHFLFLSCFSGVEFTLTFLTFDLFDWNNSQNGRLLATIGILAALIQGGYARRFTSKVGEANMARRGVFACSIAFFLLSTLPQLSSNARASQVIYLAAPFLSFTSATVVSSLTALASLQCDERGADIVASGGRLAKGRALGGFRSSGQLGRAIGPLLASASYWTFGPSITYATASASMLALAFGMGKIGRR